MTGSSSPSGTMGMKPLFHCLYRLVLIVCKRPAAAVGNELWTE